MCIAHIISRARELGGSDIHLGESVPIMIRINGRLQKMGEMRTAKQIHELIFELLNDEQKELLQKGEHTDFDFAFQTADGFRQRVNVFSYQGHLAAAIRLLNREILNIKELGLPCVLEALSEQTRGLVLITGAAGCGKSTTLAAMIQHINETSAKHIITMEDPIEYVYPSGKSLIHQREMNRDITGYPDALRSALREDPDILLVGEIRDYDTLAAVLTAAETGHLVLSTMHTFGAAESIDRILDLCPEKIRMQVRPQLAMILKGIITQELIPTVDGQKRVPATEVMIANMAVRTMIRENKCHQLRNVIRCGRDIGMHTMEDDLKRLAGLGLISHEWTESLHDAVEGRLSVWDLRQDFEILSASSEQVQHEER